MKRSHLEDRFASQWVVRYPELPFERELVIPAWREWARERVRRGLATRAVAMKADFAWTAARVALEVQGGQWVKSGHSSGTGIERDAIKALAAQLDGWALVALTERMLCRQHEIWLPTLERLIRSRLPNDADDNRREEQLVSAAGRSHTG
jgi:hypothetical protein